MHSVIALAFLSIVAWPSPRGAGGEGVERSSAASRTIFVGRVLRPEGVPAGGAVVVTSAGGRAVTGADGSFEIALDATLAAERVEVTAVVDEGVRSAGLFASALVVPPSLAPLTNVGALVLAPVASCQARWFPTFGGLRVNGDVRALQVFDDGQGAALYAGGDFTIAGGVEAHHVAKWDGSRWTALGSGIAPTGSASVRSLAVFDDGSGPALYAGGDFTGAGGVSASSIARWDGSSWSDLGNGLDGEVRALAVHDDGSGPALYAGGLFTASPGSVSVNRIARWDGTSWTALGSGMNGGVHALATHDDGSGLALYAAGVFTVAGGNGASRIARWDGSTWSGLGIGLAGSASALAVFDDGSGVELYVGGSFTAAGGVAASRIAKWDGSSWAALAGGVTDEVFALSVFDDGEGQALHAGGRSFTQLGGAQRQIARWDGSSWTLLGSGSFPLTQIVHALAPFDGGGQSALFVGGNFTLEDDVTPRHLARLDGSSLKPLEKGLNGDVHALAVFDDGSGAALYAAGRFSAAGSSQALRIARWDGSSWSPLGSGVSSYPDPVVNALAVFDDGSGPALYAGGNFLQAFGSPDDWIAKWDGTSWSGLGAGLDGEVHSLVVFDDGSGPALHVGGTFRNAGGVAANRIAKWDGTSWSALGNGVTGGIGTVVSALVVFDDGGGDALFAAGKFTVAGSVSAQRIARWDGTSWSALPGLVGGAPAALTVFDDGSGSALYAGGNFTSGSGTTLNRVGRWDGTSWSALGSGMDATVRSFTVFDDGSGPALYAGGDFTSAGGVAASGIARWDGTSWSPLAGGVGALDAFDRTVRALAVFEVRGAPALCVGGSFEFTPSRDSFLASWGCARAVRPGLR